MPELYYPLPSIGATNQTQPHSQKGPNCWYYANKMMFKFHGLHGSHQVGPMAVRWGILHQIRKATTALDDTDREAIRPQVTGDLLTAVQSRLQSMPSLLTQLGLGSVTYKAWMLGSKTTLLTSEVRSAIDQAAQATTLSGACPEALVKQLVMYCTAARQALSGSSGGNDGRASLLDGLQVNVDQYKALASAASGFGRASTGSNYDYLVDVLSPDAFHLHLRKGNKRETLKDYYNLLVKEGPFLVGGDLAQNEITRFEELPGVYVIKDYNLGTAHAVAVCGLDTDADLIAYKDPNFSDQVVITRASHFLGWSGSFDLNLGGTTQRAWAISAKCSHCNHLSPQAFPVPLGYRKGLSKLAGPQTFSLSDLE